MEKPAHLTWLHWSHDFTCHSFILPISLFPFFFLFLCFLLLLVLLSFLVVLKNVCMCGHTRVRLHSCGSQRRTMYEDGFSLSTVLTQGFSVVAMPLPSESSFLFLVSAKLQKCFRSNYCPPPNPGTSGTSVYLFLALQSAILTHSYILIFRSFDC